MTRHYLILTLLLIGLLLGGCGGETSEEAASQSYPTPVVTSTSTPIPNPDITVCADGCDFQSIQAAIDDENTQAGAIIGVEDPVHTEASILVSKDVIIQGKGAKETTVQAHPRPGEGTERGFEIALGATVGIRGMTIQHGNPRTSPFTGGGIRNVGTLTLEDTIIRDNYGSAGGGIYNEGTLTLINSTISHNGSLGGGDTYLECNTGGGMKILTGTVTLINSTISDNESRGKGGGVHVACSGILVLQNSTVSGNFSSESGGGIYINGVGDFTNSTISNNSGYTVGGVVVDGSGEKNLIRGQLSLTNTIIANNIGRLEKYGIADCYLNQYASIIKNDYSWIGDGTCAAAFSGDPALGPLEDNEGLTLTHSLLPGSPAIDAIPADHCFLETDQRGMPRLVPCDIGAFEVQE
jgi:hypothetical protein